LKEHGLWRILRIVSLAIRVFVRLTNAEQAKGFISIEVVKVMINESRHRAGAGLSEHVRQIDDGSHDRFFA
jgi:hypothetical protein